MHLTASWKVDSFNLVKLDNWQVHLSTILASFILRTFLVSYSGVLENLHWVLTSDCKCPLARNRAKV
jgi:hypothetical protein